jgi:hypothetical protein
LTKGFFGGALPARERQETALAKRRGLRQILQMQESAAVTCPFCGQSFELVIDTGVESQRFVTDCEVCCRPFEVQAECEAGQILSLDVQGS